MIKIYTSKLFASLDNELTNEFYDAEFSTYVDLGKQLLLGTSSLDFVSS